LADRPRADYVQKSFSLPIDQVRWLRELRRDALADEIDLHEVVVIREAIDRLMRLGSWRSLKQALLAQSSGGPRHGRPT
jgi:hypothetical protein